mgnify:FL=1
MKKYLPFQAILIAIVQWVSNSPISAQSEWFSPQQWESLVQDPQKNPIIRDTVLYQSFDSDNPLSINYSVSGQYDFFYPQEEGILGASDSRAIRLYPGSTLTIDTLIYPALKMAEIHIPFAFQHVNKEEDIYFTTYFYSGATESDARPYTVMSNDCSRYFRQVYAGRQCFYRGRRSNPYQLQIKVTKPASASNGYYCIDSLFLVGNIELYSLLQQSGTWHDHALWSHDYPSLRRVALIDADVQINQAAECLHLINNQKEIQIQPGGNLRTQQITTFHTFEEKGKWYFVSFPHDVYPEGIDSRFQLGDASTMTTEPVNNILYILTYDGKSRADNNQTSGNWKVISPDEVVPGEVLLQRGKGYLIAIDETAAYQTLTFSSPKHQQIRLTDNTSVGIEAQLLQSGSEAHNGWILCGNPYPSALSLQEILPNPALDGNIYIYNGTDYDSYPIGSNYKIPAGSAFFIKANQDTHLAFQKKDDEASLTMLRQMTLPYQGKEPENRLLTQTTKPTQRFHYAIQNGKIRITTTSPGELTLYNVLGIKIKHCHLTRGEREYALPQQPGIYFLHIISGSQAECIKIRK